MSTHAYIATYKVSEGVKYIYCHGDGYPSGVGRTLTRCYNSQEAADSIIALGDLSYLGNKLDPPTEMSVMDEGYDDMITNSTRSYSRDDGEEWIDNEDRSVDRPEELFDRLSGEFVYLYLHNGWHMMTKGPKWSKLIGNEIDE